MGISRPRPTPDVAFVLASRPPNVFVGVGVGIALDIFFDIVLTIGRDGEEHHVSVSGSSLCPRRVGTVYHTTVEQYRKLNNVS